MLVTADQLVAHAVGDYILQSDWMATEKTKRSLAALAHVLTYMLPFLFLRPSLPALAIIVSTHFVIDRWRPARFVVWAKNFLAPRWMHVSTVSGVDREARVIEFDSVLLRNAPWSDCVATGYPAARPAWLAVWLLIIADNIMHVLINGLALKYL